MNYYDCPKCNIRTASSRGCGICGRDATSAELDAQRAKEAAFEERRRTFALPDSDKETRHGDFLIVRGPTLLDALTHKAAMDPTPKNLETLDKYEKELRALSSSRKRSSASRRRKSEKFVEEVLPDSEYEWVIEDGHRVRRKRT